ncbi:hypothetical protein TNCV_4005581 [Trichonephila clavipes]|nr:hypothetical protein TNCV_4005581 [Trichonephila clavipes]
MYGRGKPCGRASDSRPEGLCLMPIKYPPSIHAKSTLYQALETVIPSFREGYDHNNKRRYSHPASISGYDPRLATEWGETTREIVTAPTKTTIR